MRAGIKLNVDGEVYNLAYKKKTLIKLLNTLKTQVYKHAKNINQLFLYTDSAMVLGEFLILLIGVTFEKHLHCLL